MKKLLLTTAIVAGMATSASASADGSGFFAGIYGGYTGSATSSSVNGYTGAGATGLVNISQYDLGGNGGQGGLMLGYNYAMDSGMVLGADLFGQVGSHEAKVTTGNPLIPTVRIKQKYAFGIAARLGYMFDTTHAYVRVGWINSRFEMNHFTARAPAGVTTNDNKNVNGLLLGLGADMPVGEAITVGFNYDFAMYKENSMNEAGQANPLSNVSFKPRTHSVNVVLKYKF